MYEILLTKSIFFVVDVVRHYLVIGLTKSHSDAQKACQQGNTNLASFVSQDDIYRMKAETSLIDQSGSWYFWTGLKYAKSNDTWIFIDAADTTFAKSIVTLPENVHTDRCVRIHGDGKLSVTHCTDQYGFVCQV